MSYKAYNTFYQALYRKVCQDPCCTELKEIIWEDLQDGGGVRRADHLPLHKYIKNTSTCGTTPTEHLLNAGRTPQTSQKAKNSPHTWVGQKKKGKTETKE